MNPTISVVVPCYNGARHLRQTLDCILAQSRPAFEILVVDDGSTDESAAIASSYGHPVRLIRQANKGEGGARNTGATAASGSHLLFLDADDLIRPDTLEHLAEAAGANPQAMILQRFVPFEDVPERPNAEPSRPPSEFFPEIIKTCLGVPHAWLTPASLYKQTRGFTTTQKYFVDWEFWCQIALLNPPLVVLDHVGALYRRHPSSMSSNTPTENRVRGHMAVMQTLLSGIMDQPRLLASYGQDLFWCSWVALKRANAAGVPRADLAELECTLTQMVRNPKSRLAGFLPQAVRVLGVRWANRCHKLFFSQPS